MSDRAIVWRRADKPGHEFCTLVKTETGAKLTGVAVLSNDATPYCLQYKIDCDSRWRTIFCHVTGYVGRKTVALDIRQEGEKWLMNGLEIPELTKEVEDIDLGFSPATNMLPIRRLALKVGEHAAVRVAWLRFPEFTLEPLDQTYTRLSPDIYRYESGGGTFRRDLKVDDAGMVIDYPELWYAESRA